jgi:hypothetical protein
MKNIGLIGAFLFAATIASFADDVPFAAPPPPSPGQPDTANLISLGDIMGETQWRHIKLWYAGKSGDWGLVGYEVDRIAESLRRAATLYTNIPIEFIKPAADPLAQMRAAVATKNAKQFLQSYSDLTAACNNCHTAAQIGFIRIQTPNSSPFSDEAFGR